MRSDTIVVAGSARLPENITAKHVFGYVAIELEIDLADHKIVDSSCALIPFFPTSYVWWYFQNLQCPEVPIYQGLRI
ncbi:MAG: DUF3870 domain-containing protein [Candidatus Omnitrophica bacterium]|nr:DUF3870 domain-containing protein [Candidatus Omnitrophota bacterium]